LQARPNHFVIATGNATTQSTTAGRIA